MAKKMSKKEIEGYFALAIVGGSIWLAVKFTEALGGIGNIIILGGILLAIYIAFKFLSWSNEKKRLLQKRQKLMAKYNDKEIVENIMNQAIWVGQTNEQVAESLGKPEDIDQKVLKTKKKEIWKYGYEGGNRYRVRITLENDVVIGWDNR